MSVCVSFVGVLFYEWLPAGRVVLLAGMLRAASGLPTKVWSLEVLMSEPWEGSSGEDALADP